jgi:exosortase H (IPTLxxWG-CTERM-specific)
VTYVRPFRFVLIFAFCVVFAFGVLLTPPVQFLDGALSRALVAVSHALIIVCGGHATRDDAILRAPGGFGVEMRDGCNAINVTILLWSAILAFPAHWKTKMLGLVAGSLILQLFNIVRFVSLFYLGQFSLTWFDFAHAYLWESLLMLDTMVLFWLWVNRVMRTGAAAHDV